MSQLLDTEIWLEWAKELQAISQIGLAYTKDPYDQERFERVRAIAAEMISLKSGIPVHIVQDLFCCETGYQTPKLDTRAAIFQGEKILLVEERDGTWSLPGGWVDVTGTIRSNTVKEVYEEAGLIVEATRLIALHDRNKHNEPPYAYNVCKAFVLCELIGGEFKPNNETISSAYFALDKLPRLATQKNTVAQIALCFEAKNAPHWQTLFD
jgi:ADP-ribose pyrophosphatase YjhB (NUDIX family)